MNYELREYWRLLREHNKRRMEAMDKDLINSSFKEHEKFIEDLKKEIEILKKEMIDIKDHISSDK